jgi:hypothetical protein
MLGNISKYKLWEYELDLSGSGEEPVTISCEQNNEMLAAVMRKGIS